MNRFIRAIGAALLALLLFAAAAFGGGERAKYVFLFIGDGMGEAQVMAAELYSVYGGGEPLAFHGLPVRGTITTASANAAVTDSAAAGTAIATGHKTNNGVLGMDPSGTRKLPTIAEMARDSGMKVGIVTSVFLNDATPAAFYAARPSRTDFYEIGEQLIESGFDYFAGGGIHRRRGVKNDRKDLYELAERKGYRLLRTREELASARPGEKILACTVVAGSMPYEMDRASGQLSLAELTKRGIELLDNPNGFFLMVEGGKIDWACHLNDAAASIHDTLAFDAAVREALAFADKRPETLIVVLADHETGGMSIDFERAAEWLHPLLSVQRESSDLFDGRVARFRKERNRSFERMMPLVTASFGLHFPSAQERAALEARAKTGDAAARTSLALALSREELEALRTAYDLSMQERKDRKRGGEYTRLYGPYEPLSVTITRTLDRKAGIGWSTFAHTGTPVPVFAQGTGAALFEGRYDIPDVAWKILQATGLR